MRQVLNKWVARYFADEEALILILLLITALLIIAFLGSVLAPMFAAIVLAFLLQGVVVTFKNWGLGHTTSVVLTVGVFVCVIALGLVYVFPVLWQQTGTLIKEAPRMVREGQDLLLLLPDKYPNLINELEVRNLMANLRDELTNAGQSLLSFSLAQLPILLSVLIYLVLVPILVFFFLKDGKVLVGKLSSLLPNKRSVLQSIWQEMDEQIANYVRGKAIEILIVTAVSMMVFVVFDLRYALLLSIMIGLSVLIPYIGAALVTIPVAIIAFFQFGISAEFWWIMGAYTVIQALDGNVLVPYLFGEIVKLHPVVIIGAVLVFGGIWGFWGLFFAIPLATLCKAVISAWPTREETLPKSYVLEDQVG